MTVVEQGRHQSRPVRWVGHGRMQTGKAADLASAFPVRIRRDAFADTVPSRDLLVTSEHCLHVDGRLIPARMLVNGASIVSDTTITDYAFFHLELARHAILLAEGLEAESYLDTGNRGNFNGDAEAPQPDFTLHDGHACWNSDAAAPLCVDRAVVEPIWAALTARARALGLHAPAPAVLLSEPELLLRTADGVTIRPALCDGSLYAFVVPAGVTELRLVSRSSRPSETVGPFLDDRRELGVRVGRIGVAGAGGRILCNTHLDDVALPGWHAMEGDAAGRWTTGDAVLAVGSACEPVFVDIEVLAARPYLKRAA